MFTDPPFANDAGVTPTIGVEVEVTAVLGAIAILMAACAFPAIVPAATLI
jgi:hypothetical protein